MSEALEAALVAKQTIDEWKRDENGRVHIHPDIISKAVNAVIYLLKENHD